MSAFYKADVAVDTKEGVHMQQTVYCTQSNM